MKQDTEYIYKSKRKTKRIDKAWTGNQNNLVSQEFCEINHLIQNNNSARRIIPNQCYSQPSLKGIEHTLPIVDSSSLAPATLWSISSRIPLFSSRVESVGSPVCVITARITQKRDQKCGFTWLTARIRAFICPVNRSTRSTGSSCLLLHYRRMLGVMRGLYTRDDWIMSTISCGMLLVCCAIMVSRSRSAIMSTRTAILIRARVAP